MKRVPELGAILALAALIMSLIVVAGIEALPDSLHLNVGDLATWCSGFATAAVALLAWRTSHRAAETAQLALRDQQRDEAEKVTWWLEEDSPWVPPSQPTGTLPAPMEFDPPPGVYPWEHTPPEGSKYAGQAVLRITNGGQVHLGGVRVRVESAGYVDDYSIGIKEIGALRPGVTRFIIHLENTGGSAGGNWMLSRDLYQNKLVDWLEFADSGGRVWRRHNDGKLEEI